MRLDHFRRVTILAAEINPVQVDHCHVRHEVKDGVLRQEQHYFAVLIFNCLIVGLVELYPVAPDLGKDDKRSQKESCHKDCLAYDQMGALSFQFLFKVFLNDAEHQREAH